MNATSRYSIQAVTKALNLAKMYGEASLGAYIITAEYYEGADGSSWEYFLDDEWDCVLDTFDVNHIYQFFGHK